MKKNSFFTSYLPNLWLLENRDKAIDVLYHLDKYMQILFHDDDQVHKTKLFQWFDRQSNPTKDNNVLSICLPSSISINLLYWFHQQLEEHHQRYVKQLSYVYLFAKIINWNQSVLIKWRKLTFNRAWIACSQTCIPRDSWTSTLPKY